MALVVSGVFSCRLELVSGARHELLDQPTRRYWPESVSYCGLPNSLDGVVDEHRVVLDAYIVAAELRKGNGQIHVTDEHEVDSRPIESKLGKVGKQGWQFRKLTVQFPPVAPNLRYCKH